MSRQADVVIPIYANVEVTQRCIEAVLANSANALGQLILVNDASPDAGMEPLLERVRARDSRVVVVRNRSNLGFVASVNRGLSLRERDAAILNSDTVPMTGWLGELLEVLHSGFNVAAVTPLSNNGTLCSVPRFCEAAPLSTELLRGVDIEKLERSSALPTGVGFCMLLRDAAVHMVGGLDPAFGRGYNEENDWCMRAMQRGFTVRRANRALVLHEGSVSFSEERIALEERNSRFLRQRYPFYLSHTRQYASSPEAHVAASFVDLEQSGLSVETRHSNDGVWVDYGAPLSQPTSRPSVTHVLHRWGLPPNAEALRDDLMSPYPYVLTWSTALSRSSMFNAASFEEHQRVRTLAFAAVSAAQAVIVPSRFALGQLSNELAAPVETAVVIFPPLPNSEVEETAGEEAQALGIQEPFVVCEWAGHAFDNQSLVLAAHAFLRRLHPSVQLVILGASRSPISREAGVVALSDARSQLKAWLYANASAVVDASTGDVTGSSVLRALATRRPIIASRHSSAPEWLGDAALYIERWSPEELTDLLHRVLSEGALREALRRNMDARIRSWSGVEELRALYRDVVARPSQASLTRRQWIKQLL